MNTAKLLGVHCAEGCVCVVGLVLRTSCQTIPQAVSRSFGHLDRSTAGLRSAVTSAVGGYAVRRGLDVFFGYKHAKQSDDKVDAEVGGRLGV